MKVEIPENWSAEQADAVLDLLSVLESAIWSEYEQQLVALATRQANEPIHHDDEIEDDVFPF